MSITHDEACAILRHWQPILRLADWDIDLCLVRGSWRKSGDVKVDPDDRKAVLLIHADSRPEDLDEWIVHELVHLRLNALDTMLAELLEAVFGTDAADARRAFAETRFMTLLESTTEDLTKALLSASGRAAGLSFERLRDEVDREVGPEATANVSGVPGRPERSGRRYCSHGAGPGSASSTSQATADREGATLLR